MPEGSQSARTALKEHTSTMQERVLLWTPVTADPQSAEVVSRVAKFEHMSDVHVALGQSDRAATLMVGVNSGPPQDRWFSYAELRRDVLPRGQPLVIGA